MMVNANDETLERLVLRAQKGSRDAFSEIVRILMNDIMALTYRMTGDQETAKDLAQETFVTGWEKIKTFRGEAKFKNWLLRIATNKTLNYLKKASTTYEISGEQAESVLEYSTKESSTPETDLKNKQLREDVLRFMNQLPPQQRIVFDLRFYKQLSFDEISKVTNRAVGTVKTNYRESIMKLRIWAKENGWQK